MQVGECWLAPGHGDWDLPVVTRRRGGGGGSGTKKCRYTEFIKNIIFLNNQQNLL